MATSKKEEYKYFSYTEVSNFFCTGQRDMALLLGVSQSHVAMYQSGERKLPKPAREMLRNLRDALNEAAKIEIRPEVLAQSKPKKDNEHLIWLAEERLAELKRKLAAMEEKYNKAIVTLYKLPELNIKAPVELEKNFKTWIKIAKLNCDTQRLRNHPHKQSPLRLRVAQLEAKIKNMKQDL